MENKNYITAYDASKILGCSENTIRTYAHKGLLEFLKIGQSKLYIETNSILKINKGKFKKEYLKERLSSYFNDNSNNEYKVGPITLYDIGITTNYIPSEEDTNMEKSTDFDKLDEILTNKNEKETNEKNTCFVLYRGDRHNASIIGIFENKKSAEETMNEYRRIDELFLKNHGLSISNFENKKIIIGKWCFSLNYFVEKYDFIRQSIVFTK